MSAPTELKRTGVGQEPRPRLEPHILREDPLTSYQAARGSDHADNRLIHGDNLLALPALAPEFAGRIKCIYIDPPYNTGSAYAHYDDRLVHTAWLTQMAARLPMLRQLLRDDGVLFVSVDEREMAYLVLLLDEVFGRANSCGHLIWEKKKKPSFLNAQMGSVTEYILAYARDRKQAPSFIAGRTTAGKKYPLNNAGNGRRTLLFPAGAVEFRCADQIFAPQDMSEGNILTVLLDRLEVRAGRNVEPFRLDGEWRYAQATLDALVAAGERLVISKPPFRPNHIKVGGAPKKLKNLLSIRDGMCTYEDATAESRALFGTAHAFAYPKPEKLLATLIGAVTDAGDWVLDAYAGSGTTGVVAHKLRRRWVMIEQGEHCHTHIRPRLRKVIDGQDPGGITAAVAWPGGGGFRSFRLAAAAPPL